ncbi:DMT family transporter [Acinetobacter sp. S40]|uniref:DMT family transporter n=1 Tax=Acinetobacter sp. S40 TaxID=2767434 RepID=UPI0019093AB5|nr:DMT family transporter [Acinetobacter sp. S40]
MNYIFPLLAALLWGGNTIVTKLCSTVINPMEIGFYRWLVATIILTPFVIKTVSADVVKLRPLIPKLVLLGFLGGVIFQSLAYYAAHYTTATNMGIIQSLMPIMAIILAITFLGYITNWGSILGVVVSAMGVVVVVSHGDLTLLIEHGINFGDMLMLLATLAFALYGSFVHKWNLDIPLLHSVYIQSVAATIILFPLFLITPKSHLSLEVSFYIGFAGIAASILAPMVWMHGIAKIGAARASLFFNLVPVVTAILAVFFLSEKITTSVLVGGGIAIIGVVMAETFRSQKNLNNSKVGKT